MDAHTSNQIIKEWLATDFDSSVGFGAIEVGNDALEGMSLDGALVQHPEISSEIILAYLTKHCAINNPIYQHIIHCTHVFDEFAQAINKSK